MGKVKQKNKIVIYQAKSGAIELRGDFSHETVWATQAQVAQVFGIERSVITKHIKNIYKEKELEEKSVCAIFAHTAEDGKTYSVQHYNLDAIISIGYRVNSKTATRFRQWATKTLRAYIVEGYVVNRKLIARNYKQFLNVVEDVKRLLPTGSAVNPKDAVELVSFFADTWLSLDAYDKELLPKGKLTKKKVSMTGEKVARDLAEFKKILMKKGEATELFGKERTSGVMSGIVGNVMQSFGGKEFYETAEEKAAHLLYFMVKNHPFTDGNKRSGAFAFVWFLRQATLLDVNRLTPSALTAITVLVAESNPTHKDKVIKLILNLISKKL